MDMPNRVTLHSVTMPSDTHATERFPKNYATLASASRFAIAPQKTMQEDLAKINAHLARTSDAPPSNVVVEHNLAANHWEIRVGGRVYQTHPPKRGSENGSVQLFPVEGDQVQAGTGAVEVGQVLVRLGKLTTDRAVVLEQRIRKQAAPGTGAVPPKQMGKEERTQLDATFRRRLQAAGRPTDAG
jgi:hypothetical protein